MKSGAAARPAVAILGVLLFCFGSCFAAGTGIDYATTIQPIYNNYCILCHNSPSGSGLQDLTAGNSYAATVNVQIMVGGPSGPFRVRPDLTNQSGIFQVIVTDGSGAAAGMGSWIATAADKNNITNWINQGALPDTSAPTVTSISPNSGPIAGGTSVTITGTKFGGTGTFLPTVTIGGAAASNVVVAAAPNSFTTITCKVPAHNAGGADVIVTTTAGGASPALTNGFTYMSPIPTITNINPNVGPQAGGQSVTLTGTNFVSGATVTFGGNAATNIVVVSSTQITCTTPAHAPGAADVVVTTSGGIVTSTGGYTYFNAPTLTNVSPSRGLDVGGDSVTLSGTNFLSAATVTFGGLSALSIVVVNAGQITCTTPAHSAAMVDVVVTTPGGSSTLTNGFTYQSAPTITTINPNAGPSAGGQNVTITGTNFLNGATVTFGGTGAANINVAGSTQIICTTPAHLAGTADVVVTTSAASVTSAGGYTYYDPPTLTGVSPGSGPAGGGLSVTLTGTNFVSGANITFDGLQATNINVVSTTQIACLTPAHAVGSVDVVVTTPGGTVTLAGGFTYNNSPTIKTIVPDAGPAAGGQNVTLTGTDFESAATLTFGGTPALNIVVSSATKITCTTPSQAAGAADVVVTTSAGTWTTTGGYTFFDAPTITSVAPNTGPSAGGQSISIAGTNFIVGASVVIGGTAATNIVVASGTQIHCVTPLHVAGNADVVVTTAGGAATSTGAYTFFDAPTLASVAPNFGLIAGGKSITLTGTNFITGTTVTFGGTSATGIVVSSATQITCSTPAHASGAVDVVVNNAGGAATLMNGFTYFAVPAITSADNQTFVVATPGSFTINVTGTPALAITVSGTLPSNIMFVDHGNGTATLSGTPGAGSAGVYNLTITATNLGGSMQQNFTLTIITPPPVVGSGIDSDGDGFSDAFETAVGTNPLDASSTPFGGLKAPPPIPLTLTSASISLNFAKDSSDTIKLSGVVNIPAGFAPLGNKVFLDVGGVVNSFTLDGKGSAKSGTDSLKISIKAAKGVVAAQTSKFAVALSKGLFTAQLASSQLTNTTISKSPVTITISLLINNTILQTSKNMLYTAKQGKSGTAK